MYTAYIPIDLGFNHFPLSIKISTFPITNSTSYPYLFNYNKPAKTNTSLTSTPTAHLLQSLLHFLFLKPPTPSPKSSMMLLPFLFLSATSTVLLKLGGFLKLQKLFRKTRRLFQGHTVL